MRSLFDVNALIALHDPSHVFHSSIQVWWANNAVHGWASCPLTQNGFLRIVTQASYPSHQSIREAASRLRKAMRSASHEFWPDEVSIADDGLFDDHYLLGAKQITDVYLLGLAVRRGGRLVTFDRGIARAAVKGAEPPSLVVLA